MLFGHNSDVKVGETVYHVQTEDRGAATAVIDTTVYFRGRVLQRRTSKYGDLLPLDTEREKSLRKRIDDQHRGIIEELRNGALALPAVVSPTPAGNPLAGAEKVAPPTGTVPALTVLSLELLNAKAWLTGKHANLQIAVRERNAVAVAGAKVVVRVDGAASKSEFTGKSGADGTVHIEFDMPALTTHEAALVIEATQGAASGHLRFQLRSKPRVPAS